MTIVESRRVLVGRRLDRGSTGGPKPPASPMVGVVRSGKFKGVAVTLGDYFCKKHPFQMFSYTAATYMHGTPRLALARRWCPQCEREIKLEEAAERARHAEHPAMFAALQRKIDGLAVLGERMRRREGTPISSKGGKHVERLLRARRISGEKRTRRD